MRGMPTCSKKCSLPISITHNLGEVRWQSPRMNETGRCPGGHQFRECHNNSRARSLEVLADKFNRNFNISVPNPRENINKWELSFEEQPGHGLTEPVFILMNASKHVHGESSRVRRA